ncbi:uncharacterized protein LOC129594762 [Paramacrobiotus metropolitanus]|uniref:uncharacterized protein LOC129594762 n=1 Tax=Paramacrobiotus metropolitanus TaxID=2943436 RepID=UPI002445F8F3|nr:uncharacterized protein LOC129594762 [Paramacrobiotus metropolitanus]
MDLHNTTASNWSRPAQPAARANWSVITNIRIAIALASFIMNAGVLIFHFVKRSFITHFTIYLLFLYIANTIYLVGAQPIQFLSDIYSVNVAYFGPAACGVYSYAQRVVSIVPVMAHVLIAVNRLWAMTYPIGYKNHHTKKVATYICVAMAGYVHLICLPAFILYMPFRYKPDASGVIKCEGAMTPMMFVWTRVDSCLNRFVPLFLIIGVYIYIFIKRWSKRTNQVTHNTNSTERQDRTQTTKLYTAMPGIQEESVGHSSFVERAKQQQMDRPRRETVGVRKVKPFLVLTMTTVGVIVCWLPLDVIYFCMVFLYMPIGYAVSGALHMLYTVQILFDPLMWIFSLRKP